MDYHLFKKATKSKNKIIHRWYYYFIDPVSGKKIQKVCKNCAAEFLPQTLDGIEKMGDLTFEQIADKYIEMNIAHPSVRIILSCALKI